MLARKQHSTLMIHWYIRFVCLWIFVAAKLTGVWLIWLTCWALVPFLFARLNIFISLVVVVIGSFTFLMLKREREILRNISRLWWMKWVLLKVSNTLYGELRDLYGIFIYRDAVKVGKMQINHKSFNSTAYARQPRLIIVQIINQYNNWYLF